MFVFWNRWWFVSARHWYRTATLWNWWKDTWYRALMDFSQLPWPDTIALHLRGLLVTSRYFQDTPIPLPWQGEKVLIVLPQWTLFLICWPPPKNLKSVDFFCPSRDRVFSRHPNPGSWQGYTHVHTCENCGTGEIHLDALHWLVMRCFAFSCFQLCAFIPWLGFWWHWWHCGVNLINPEKEKNDFFHSNTVFLIC